MVRSSCNGARNGAMRSVDPISPTRMTKQLAVARTARMGLRATAALLWNENMETTQSWSAVSGSRRRTTS